MKKIIAFAVLLVLFIFVLACIDSGAYGGMYMATETQALQRGLEKKTGQDLDGWTLEELEALEAELIRLEEEKEQAQAQEDTQTAEESQETGQESTEVSEMPQEQQKEPETPTVESKAPEEIPNDEISLSINGKWIRSDGFGVEIVGSTGTIYAIGSISTKFAEQISIGSTKFRNISKISEDTWNCEELAWWSHNDDKGLLWVDAVISMDSDGQTIHTSSTVKNPGSGNVNEMRLTYSRESD